MGNTAHWRTDESCIPFYSIVELTGQAWDQAIQETFIVSQLKEDAILRMPFLMRHKCHIDFSKSAVVMAWWELTCVDHFGHPLVRGVQVVWSCTIPGRSRATIHCRMNSRRFSGLGVVEGAHKKIPTRQQLESAERARGDFSAVCKPIQGLVELSARSICGPVSPSPGRRCEAVFGRDDREPC